MNMFWKSIILWATLLVSGVAIAQNQAVSVGVKVGGNISNFRSNTAEAVTQPGFLGGVTFEYRISDLVFINSGVNADFRKTKYSYKTQVEGVETFNSFEASPFYLEAPLHLSTKLPTGYETFLTIHGGPYFAVGVGGKERVVAGTNLDGTTSGNSSNYFNSHRSVSDFGLGLGAGLQMSKIVFDLGYNHGLTKLNKSGDVQIQNQTAYFTIGYIF